MKEKLTFDVMLNERFIKTLSMPYCSLFILDPNEVKEFVEKELPFLKGKDFKIAI